MNRILKVILLFVCFYCFNVYAYELNYSEWSLEYPTDVKEEFIYSEDRYLWYRENEVNVEYLIKEEIGNKQVDYNTFINSEESEPSLEQPTIYEDRIINEKVTEYYYYPSNMDRIIIDNFSDELLISEIEIYNKNTSNKTSFDVNIPELIDGDLDSYNSINDSIIINFKNQMSMSDIIIRICFNDESFNKTFDFSVLSSDDFKIYNNTFTINNSFIAISTSNLNYNKIRKETTYTYIDKLYKTYDIEIEYSDDYYKELDGYIKDESSKKTYYRYITNDTVYYSDFYHIPIPDKQYCVKNRCTVVSTKKEVTIIENPQTIDNIDIYFILLIISFIIIVSVLLIRLIKRKSSYVESVELDI